MVKWSSPRCHLTPACIAITGQFPFADGKVASIGANDSYQMRPFNTCLLCTAMTSVFPFADGKVASIGANDSYQMGWNCRTQDQTTFHDAEGLTDIKSIAAGGQHCLALNKEGKVLTHRCLMTHVAS